MFHQENSLIKKKKGMIKYEVKIKLSTIHYCCRIEDITGYDDTSSQVVSHPFTP